MENFLIGEINISCSQSIPHAVSKQIGEGRK
jgi:hypothetical protein